MKSVGKKAFIFLICVAWAQVTASAASADCTTIIGMSQTRDTADGLNRIGAGDFILLWKGNQEIESWADGTGYDGIITRYNFCNGDDPYHSPRVAIQLSAPSHSVDQIVENTGHVINQIKSRFPYVQEIVLVTVSGGPQGNLCSVTSEMRSTRNCVDIGDTCYVRASEQNPRVWQALQAVRETLDVTVYRSLVNECTEFRDGKGHLTSEGKRASAITWWNEWVARPSPIPEPVPGPEPVSEPEPAPNPRRGV